MSNLLLAAFGTLVTMLALAGFSVWQLQKIDAQAHGPGTRREPAGSAPAEDAPRAT